MRITLKKLDSCIVFHDDGSVSLYLSKIEDEEGNASTSCIMAAAIAKKIANKGEMQALIDELDEECNSKQVVN